MRRCYFKAVVLLSVRVALFGQTTAPPFTVLTNVTVIEGTGAPGRPGMTLVISEGRIRTMGRDGSSPLPAGAQVFNGQKGFVMPGLWDMHVHLSWARISALPALVANGVTGVRDLGGLLRELDEWRVRSESGVLIGPRIVRCGPVLNGRAFAFHQFAVTNAAEAAGAVRALEKAGVDCIKVHRAISRDAYFGAVRECKRLGLPLVGHIPNTVTPLEASEAGQASIEHVATLFDGTFATQHKDESLGRALQEFVVKEAPDLFAVFAKNGTAFTPTLTSHAMAVQFGREQPDPRDRYVSRSARKMGADLVARDRAELTPAYYAKMDQQLQVGFPIVKAAQQAGVRILAGTDLAIAGTYPGFGLHDELGLLVRAGLSPMQALQAATRNAAEFLKLKDEGTVAVGKMANLVLLDANPLLDIHNTTRIRAVVLRGRYLDRGKLDELLKEAEREAGEN